jgi:MFS family permease
MNARGRVLGLLAGAQLIIALDATIVYVALPDMGRSLGFSPQSLQWVISAYAVAFGGGLLLGGRAADLLGRRRMFVLALGLYAVSSLAGGLATGPGLIVAARAVQGLGGALLFPTTLSLVNITFAEGPERNRALAVWGGAGASGLSIGSLLGGLLTQGFGWPAVFYVNVPVAAVVALLALLWISPDGPREHGHRFDLPGAATVTGGVALLVYGLVQGPAVGWASADVVTTFALGAALLAAFCAIEVRSAEPLMPPRLLRNGSLRAAMTITFVFMATFGAEFYVLTIYFQDVLGYTALQAGLGFLLPSIVIFAGTQFGERITTRHTVRATLVTGMLIGAAGIALLAWQLHGNGSYLAATPGIVLYAFGQGTTWTGMWIAAAAGVQPSEQGVASGMASTAMQIGVALGLAVLVAIANSDVGGRAGSQLQHHLAVGLQHASFLAAAAILLGATLVLRLRAPNDAPAPVPLDSRQDAHACQG